MGLLDRLRRRLQRAPRTRHEVALELAQTTVFEYELCWKLLAAVAGDVAMAERYLQIAQACAVHPLWVARHEEQRLRGGGDLRPGQSPAVMTLDVYSCWIAARRAAGKAVA